MHNSDLAAQASGAGRRDDDQLGQTHELRSADGDLRLWVAELGATVRRLEVPDREGKPRNVALGHAQLGDARGGSDYFGSVAGRFANRIARGSFELDGATVVVPANEGPHALHGGPDGFDQRVWRTTSSTASAVTLALASPDGDQGFPGNLTVDVTYSVLGQRVSIAYRVTTDAPTVVNLTNPSYVNLDGEAAPTVDGHRLLVDADQFLPVTTDLIPTGERRGVAGGPFDFRTSAQIGPRLRRDDPQLVLAHGLDHTFIVRGSGLRRHAVLSSDESGIEMTVLSDQPGIQVYTGNFLDGSVVGTGGRLYRQGAGIALEA